jgi:hypothetical protein
MSELAVVKWKPKHDQVVAYHLMGYTNNHIAELCEYEREHVSRILNDPRAIKAIRTGRYRFMERAHAEIGERIVHLADVGVKKMRETVDADFTAGSPAKMHQDRVTFALLDRIGYGKTSAGNQTDSGIKLSQEGEKNLISAIEKANEAREIVITDSEVIDEPASSNGTGTSVSSAN